MAIQTVTQADVERAIHRLSNVQGALMCAVKLLDDHEQMGDGLWEVSEAIHGTIEAIRSSYCTLTDADVAVTVKAVDA